MTEHNEHQTFKADEIPCQEISDPAVLPKKPLVSVHMITYNHEPYIAQAIEGVLMQETDFPIELVIGEDCSTDRTYEIVLEYQKKHPAIIRVVTSEHNVDMIKNCLRTIKACRGKYIAFCEGDDYWTDPKKLQKQVNFLESNKDFVLCYHRIKQLHNDCLKEISDLHSESVLTIDKLARKMSIMTLSVLLRNGLLQKMPIEYWMKITGSYFIFMYLSQFGKIKRLEEFMGVYRKHSGGIWSGKDLRGKSEMEIKNKILMIEYFKDPKIQKELIKSYVESCLSYFIRFAIKLDIKNALYMLTKSFKYGLNLFHFIYLPKLLYNKMKYIMCNRNLQTHKLSHK